MSKTGAIILIVIMALLVLLAFRAWFSERRTYRWFRHACGVPKFAYYSSGKDAELYARLMDELMTFKPHYHLWAGFFGRDLMKRISPEYAQWYQRMLDHESW